MGLRGALLRLANGALGHMGLRLVRKQHPDKPRKVFVRGDFFNVLETRVPGSRPTAILDVGAYDGRCAKRFCDMFPQARVYSYEPSPESFSLLAEVSVLPEYARRIMPYRIALSNHAGKRAFNRHQAPQTDSLLDVSPEAREQWPDLRFMPIAPVESPVETIDRVCNQENIEYIDILKIDAQGEDFRVLQGAESMLLKRKIGIIVVELYFVPVYDTQGNPQQIIQYLLDHGFSEVAYLCHDVDSTGKLLCVDAVFECKRER